MKGAGSGEWSPSALWLWGAAPGPISPVVSSRSDGARDEEGTRQARIPAAIAQYLLRECGVRLRAISV